MNNLIKNIKIKSLIQFYQKMELHAKEKIKINCYYFLKNDVFKTKILIGYKEDPVKDFFIKKTYTLTEGKFSIFKLYFPKDFFIFDENFVIIINVYDNDFIALDSLTRGKENSESQLDYTYKMINFFDLFHLLKDKKQIEINNIEDYNSLASNLIKYN